MVHGILQFTPSIAFRYVLHRCESRDIRCRESFRIQMAWDAAGVPCYVSFPWRLRRRGLVAGRGLGRAVALPRSEFCSNRFAGRSFLCGIDNDPSAGSPTETLLRLLLPLNDKVQWTSRDVAGSEPPTSPRSEHFTGPFNR